jgi:hypothetical protein
MWRCADREDSKVGLCKSLICFALVTSIFFVFDSIYDFAANVSVRPSPLFVSHL